jgi:hypothetical protein
MFYWIYDVPSLWVIVLFEAAFCGRVLARHALSAPLC